MEKPAAFLPIILITAISGSVLGMCLGLGAKWFMIVYLLNIVFFLSFLAKDPKVVGICLLTACIPVFYRYFVLRKSRATEFATLGFGAEPELVIYAVDIPIAILIVIWLVYLAVNKDMKVARWTGFDTFVLLFLLLSSFSLLATEDYSRYFFEMLRYLKYYLLYWVLRSFLEDRNCLTGLFVVTFVMCWVNFLVSITQYIGISTFMIPGIDVSGPEAMMANNQLIIRVSGLSIHPNTFAHYLSFPVCFGICFLFIRAKTSYKILLIPIILSGVICLALTFSRSGWLSFFVIVMIISVISLMKKRYKLFYVVLFLASLLLIIGLIFLTGIWSLILSRLIGATGGAVLTRLELIKVAYNFIIEHPVFGVGLNSFTENMAQSDIVQIFSNAKPLPVHNIYLLVAAETGIPAMICFIAMGGLLVRYSWKLMDREAEQPFLIGMIGVTVISTFAITNLADITLRMESIIGMMTLVVSMIISEYTRQDSPVDLEKASLPANSFGMGIASQPKSH